MQLQTIESDDGVSRVKLIGSLDSAGMHEIDTQFQAATSDLGLPCIVDLSELEFIGSLGMGMLVTCARALQREGKRLILLSPREDVEDSLISVGIAKAIPIASSEQQACEILSTNDQGSA